MSLFQCPCLLQCCGVAVLHYYNYYFIVMGSVLTVVNLKQSVDLWIGRERILQCLAFCSQLLANLVRLEYLMVEFDLLSGQRTF